MLSPPPPRHLTTHLALVRDPLPCAGASTLGISRLLSPQLLRSLVLNVGSPSNTLHSAAQFALGSLLASCHQDGERSAGARPVACCAVAGHTDCRTARTLHARVHCPTLSNLVLLSVEHAASAVAPVVNPPPAPHPPPPARPVSRPP